MRFIRLRAENHPAVGAGLDECRRVHYGEMSPQHVGGGPRRPSVLPRGRPLALPRGRREAVAGFSGTTAVKQWSSIIGLIILVFLAGVSLLNQIQYTIIPFAKSYRSIPMMLSKDDMGLLKELGPAYYLVAQEINKYPKDTNFFFWPALESAQGERMMHWYLYILLRYLCYPRRIFSIHEDMYNANKGDFKTKFAGGGERYLDLEWINKHNIKYIILLRNARVFILPVEERIVW